MSLLIFAASCSKNDTPSTAQSMPQTETIAASSSETKGTSSVTSNSEDSSENYKEVLSLYFEAPNRELLDTLFYSPYAFAMRMSQTPEDSDDMKQQEASYQELEAQFHNLFSDEGVDTYMENPTLLLKYQMVTDEIQAQMTLDEISFESESAGAVNWNGQVTLSWNGEEQTFPIEGNLSLDEEGKVRYINQEGDGGLYEACKQIYQQQSSSSSSEE